MMYLLTGQAPGGSPSPQSLKILGTSSITGLSFRYVFSFKLFKVMSLKRAWRFRICENSFLFQCLLSKKTKSYHAIICLKITQDPNLPTPIHLLTIYFMYRYNSPLYKDNINDISSTY